MRLLDSTSFQRSVAVRCLGQRFHQLRFSKSVENFERNGRTNAKDTKRNDPASVSFGKWSSFNIGRFPSMDLCSNNSVLASGFSESGCARYHSHALWHSEDGYQFGDLVRKQPAYLDVLYTPMSNAMKAMDDLFRPEGTSLYPPLTDDLNNYKQWRWQNKTVSEAPEVYLKVKQDAASWVESVLPEVHQLSAALAPHHQEMFVHGYEILAAAATGPFSSRIFRSSFAQRLARATQFTADRSSKLRLETARGEVVRRCSSQSRGVRRISRA